MRIVCFQLCGGRKRRRRPRRRQTRRRRYAAHPLSANRQLNLHYTKATTSSAPGQTAATRDSHGRLLLERNTSPSRHGCKTTVFQAGQILLNLSFCIERISFANQRGPPPKHCSPLGKSALCLQGIDCTSDHCHGHDLLHVPLESLKSRGVNPSCHMCTQDPLDMG